MISSLVTHEEELARSSSNVLIGIRNTLTSLSVLMTNGSIPLRFKRMSCHLASCHTCTCHPIVRTNIVVNRTPHVHALIDFLYGCTHMFYDIVEIHKIIMRDNKWLVYTLHLCMKDTKYYFQITKMQCMADTKHPSPSCRLAALPS